MTIDEKMMYGFWAGVLLTLGSAGISYGIYKGENQLKVFRGILIILLVVAVTVSVCEYLKTEFMSDNNSTFYIVIAVFLTIMLIAAYI